MAAWRWRSGTCRAGPSAATGSSRASRCLSRWPGRRRAATWRASPIAWSWLAQGPAGTVARLRIRLDLFELLEHQREGYLPSVAELQGRYLELLIFKNELSAAPYQEVVLTTGSGDAHRIRRERDGRLVMTRA